MEEPRLLQRVTLTSAHRSTGKTRHFRGGELLPKPYELRIVQYRADRGFYLFYCDESGVEMTDTYHDSLEKAMGQAEFEFEVTPEEWSEVES